MTDSKKEKTVPAGTEEAPRRRSRRQALALAGAGAAAATVAALGIDRSKKGHAAPGDPLILGQGNSAGTQPTGLDATVDGGNALLVANLGSGDVVGLAGSCPNGTGVHGFSDKTAGVEGHTRGSPSPSNPFVVGVAGFSLNPAGGDELGPGVGVSGRSGTGPGLAGDSLDGPGVDGRSQTSFGVGGQSDSGHGVAGVSESGHGVGGATHGIPSPPEWPAGVVGVSLRPGVPPDSTDPGDRGSSLGVLGASGSGTGVVGTSETGVGTAGVAPGDAPGVTAFSGSATGGPGGLPLPDGGLALFVVGKAQFATAGSGVVPARADAAAVSDPAVTADSHITVTFTGDPGNRATVIQWVERQPDSGFIVHLSGRPSRDVPFTYLIVEPGVWAPAG